LCPILHAFSPINLCKFHNTPNPNHMAFAFTHSYSGSFNLHTPPTPINLRKAQKPTIFLLFYSLSCIYFFLLVWINSFKTKLTFFINFHLHNRIIFPDRILSYFEVEVTALNFWIVFFILPFLQNSFSNFQKTKLIYRIQDKMENQQSQIVVVFL
jgi:hypothetical protein